MSRHLTFFLLWSLLCCEGSRADLDFFRVFSCSVSNFVFTQKRRVFVSAFPFFSVPSLNQTEEDVVALVKQSLSNLQTEYIDLWVELMRSFLVLLIFINEAFFVCLIFAQIFDSLAGSVWAAIRTPGQREVSSSDLALAGETIQIGTTEVNRRIELPYSPSRGLKGVRDGCASC